VAGPFCRFHPDDRGGGATYGLTTSPRRPLRQIFSRAAPAGIDPALVGRRRSSASILVRPAVATIGTFNTHLRRLRAGHGGAPAFGCARLEADAARRYRRRGRVRLVHARSRDLQRAARRNVLHLNPDLGSPAPPLLDPKPVPAARSTTPVAPGNLRPAGRAIRGARSRASGFAWRRAIPPVRASRSAVRANWPWRPGPPIVGAPVAVQCCRRASSPPWTTVGTLAGRRGRFRPCRTCAPGTKRSRCLSYGPGRVARRRGLGAAPVAVATGACNRAGASRRPSQRPGRRSSGDDRAAQPRAPHGAAPRNSPVPRPLTGTAAPQVPFGAAAGRFRRALCAPAPAGSVPAFRVLFAGDSANAAAPLPDCAADGRPLSPGTRLGLNRPAPHPRHPRTPPGWYRTPTARPLPAPTGRLPFDRALRRATGCAVAVPSTIPRPGVDRVRIVLGVPRRASVAGIVFGLVRSEPDQEGSGRAARRPRARHGGDLCFGCLWLWR